MLLVFLFLVIVPIVAIVYRLVAFALKPPYDIKDQVHAKRFTILDYATLGSSLYSDGFSHQVGMKIKPQEDILMEAFTVYGSNALPHNTQLKVVLWSITPQQKLEEISFNTVAIAGSFWRTILLSTPRLLSKNAFYIMSLDSANDTTFPIHDHSTGYIIHTSNNVELQNRRSSIVSGAFPSIESSISNSNANIPAIDIVYKIKP